MSQLRTAVSSDCLHRGQISPGDSSPHGHVVSFMSLPPNQVVTSPPAGANRCGGHNTSGIGANR